MAAALVYLARSPVVRALADAHTAPPSLASIRGTLSLADHANAPEGDVRFAVLREVEAGDRRASTPRMILPTRTESST
jgi:hypothetical protein